MVDQGGIIDGIVEGVGIIIKGVAIIIKGIVIVERVTIFSETNLPHFSFWCLGRRRFDEEDSEDEFLCAVKT